MKFKSLTNAVAVLLTGINIGCSTSLDIAERLKDGGKAESFLVSPEKMEERIKKYWGRDFVPGGKNNGPGLIVYRVNGKPVYAEGRTYGIRFAEFAISPELLDGSARDGFRNSYKLDNQTKQSGEGQ